MLLCSSWFEQPTNGEVETTRHDLPVKGVKQMNKQTVFISRGIVVVV